MHATREIWWNIGPTDVLSMYLLAFLALSVAGWGVFRRIRHYRRFRPLERLDQLPRRLRMMLAEVFSHRALLRAPLPGGLHLLLFLSFLLLLLGTFLILLQENIGERFPGALFLEGRLYEAFSLMLDLAGAAALAAVSLLALRRLASPPPGGNAAGDFLILLLLLAILLSGFMVEGVRLAATEIPSGSRFVSFSPVGAAAAGFFSGKGGAELTGLHLLLWWVHFLLAAAFIAILPFSKLRHLLTAPANLALRDLSLRGALPSLPLDGSVERYGAGRASDLTWKDVLDSDACTGCSRCRDRCPVSATSRPYSPMEMVRRIGSVALAAPEADLAAAIGEEGIWSCTTCRACQESCPAGVEHVNKIIEMRRNLTLMEGKFAGAEVRRAMDSVEITGNPFGLPFASRGEWASGLDTVPLHLGGEADILYFVGCYASFDPRNREVARNFVRICNRAGVSVGILGRSEKCCGEPLRKLGNELLFQEKAVENIAHLRRCRVRKIVTTCPHCFISLGQDYAALGLDLPVEHHTTFLWDLLRGGRFGVAADSFEVTFHDSCSLSRLRGIVQEPRALLAAVGGKVVEMRRSGTDTFCCGGGGGRILAEETSGSRINAARVEMAVQSGAPVVASSCPFCLSMLEDGIRSGGFERELRVADVAELLAARIR